MSEENRLWDSEKFWIIWLSCIDQARSVKEIISSWDYKENSKALYKNAPGSDQSIGREMEEKGFVEGKTFRKKGATGKKLKSKLDWLPEYIDKKFSSGGPFAGIWKDPNKFIGLLKEDWVQNKVLNLENIKLIYSGKKDYVRRSPNAYLSCIMYVFLETIVEDREDLGPMFSLLSFEDLLNNLLADHDVEINYKEFKEKVTPIIKKNKGGKFEEFKKEINDLFDDLLSNFMAQ